MVREGVDWIKECQISVEIDADKASTSTGQNGHLGCEIFFVNKKRCIGKTMKDSRAGLRIFKTHAYLPDGLDSPHYRRGPHSEEEAISQPAPRLDQPGSDLTILYRCRLTRTGLPQ